jgi:hypothetical protein
MGSRGTAAVYETNRSGRADNKVLQNFLPASPGRPAIPTIRSQPVEQATCIAGTNPPRRLCNPVRWERKERPEKSPVAPNFCPAGHLSEAVPLTIQSVVTKFGQCWNAANEESGVISSM